MTMQRTGWLPACLLAAVILLAGGCSDDDDGGSNPVAPPPPMSETLPGYWPANADLGESLAAADQTLDEIAAAFGDKTVDAARIDTLVNRYLAQCEAAAAQVDRLLEIEESIRPYGAADKGIFTDTATAVVKGVYNVVKKTVVSSAQMVRTGWRVLSGRYTLREALRAPDSGIPIVSDFAKRLQEHQRARDERIVQSILAGDDQEGFVPLDQLPGSTPQEKADYYRNLPDDHPLKKEMRGNVHLWDDGEKQETVKTLTKVTRDQVKNYVGVVSDSELLPEIADQMLSKNQDPADKGSIRPTTRDHDSGAPVTAPKTMIVVKKDQPTDNERVAILQGVDPQMEIPLAGGTYDIVTIAEGYIRSVQAAVVVARDQATDFLQRMYDYARHSLVIEELDADPATPLVGEPVTVRATAASIIGETLSFAWSVSGGETADAGGDGPTYVFTPRTAGDYTVALTVTDGLGNTRSATLDLRVAPAGVTATACVLAEEQVYDGQANPGERVTWRVTLANGGDADVTCDVTVAGHDRIEASVPGKTTVTVPAGDSVDIEVVTTLPVDFSGDEGRVTLSYESDDVVLEQDLEFPVVFGVDIDPVDSPVTERVLRVTGLVKNPSLPTATLIVDEDPDQLFVVDLDEGRFSQEIALPATAEETGHTVRVVADAGNRREEATASFTSRVPPAALRVTLTWDTGGTDVDLWVTDPDGEKCYYANPTTASGLVLDFDDRDGYGPENITTEAVEPGDYLVQVHYYTDYDEEAAIGTACTVVIRIDEGTPDEQVSTHYGYLADTGDLWTVTTLTFDGARWRLAPGDARGRVAPGRLPAKR